MHTNIYAYIYIHTYIYIYIYTHIYIYICPAPTMIYVLRDRKLPGGFLIYHIVHIDICCHTLLGANIYEITWSIDLKKIIWFLNATVQLLTFNAVFNNTAIGLNRKFFSSRNSAKPMKMKRASGCFYALYYTFTLAFSILPSFKEMILMCWLTLYVPNIFFPHR